ncbi:TetR/AcrR family transcriptional regulator [Nocardioides bruguierae]|uniref:TetR/AcrR family transcriptional regulator n=1 Tax=Nocardioides bruguierae TaxID=2945102 RepID=A0A9X2D993_9ACTN|nr:TetR/AcrR family transcriptional regulator [Nocardioides bruguierae]MCM0621688.1 TetR/AcrR family transcriptional regulator [Nocardioides bruguierae]
MSETTSPSASTAPSTSSSTSSSASARDRLRAAAFRLFEEQGFEATTTGEIAAAAGVGRTTFFRAFGTKEDVVFPDHDEVLARVNARLDAALDRVTLTDVTEATGLVLGHYLAEGDLARARYRLIRQVSSLRDREAASTVRYQRVFRDALRGWTGEEAGSDLRAELLAGAVVAGHNHILRAWLRSEETGPEVDARARRDFAAAMATVASGLVAGPADGAGGGTGGGTGGGAGDGSTVVVLRSGQDPAALLPALRQALGLE